MFLKSLSMKGFKSFADPTVLEFEPGITVVVGPNGSGKSNVVDAVTWVMGAQGPRSLRSQKMEDVIFAGTSSRAALGRAEVALTIDNSSGKLPLDMAEVTISRTLFRSGDSEYAINGASCRLLDIQELLSDTGVGRQQHMIIGQGQLDTILNARPEDRRAIIEEAAGVRKHRRRRERAERRLLSTQENLERLGDLVREVRRQIRPLERQAAAARSHSALAGEWMALRRYLAGCEMAELANRLELARDSLRKTAEESEEMEATLASLDRAATITAAELSSRREEDLASALGTAQGLVERTRGTANVLRERSRALAASLDAAADVDVVSTLEAESANLAEQLVTAKRELLELDPQISSIESAQSQLASDEDLHLSTWGDGSEVKDAEEALASANGRAELLRRSVEQAQSSVRGIDSRIAALVERHGEAKRAESSLTDKAPALESAKEELMVRVDGARSEVKEASEKTEAAESEATRAERDRHRTAARAEALSRALQELQGSGDRELLAGVTGVVGSLLDLVEIDPGWEAAFEAAVGASVAAVVVDGRDAARAALSVLSQRGGSGAVLAALGGSTLPFEHDPKGSTSLLGTEPVRPHVRGRGGSKASGIDSVLDALVGGVVRVPHWENAIDLAIDRPDLVVVTVDGDRFARSGWRVRSSGGVVTAAAVEEAMSKATEAAKLADLASAALGQARQVLERARLAEVAAARALDRHESEVHALDADRRRWADERRRLSEELDETRQTRGELESALRADTEALGALEASVPQLHADLAIVVDRREMAQASRRALDERRSDLATARQQVELVAAGIVERQRVLEHRLSEVERRLRGHSEEREVAAARRLQLEADGRALRNLSELTGTVRGRLESFLEAIQLDYRHQMEAVRAGGERLETLRRDRAALERRLSLIRDRSRSLELESAEVSVRSEALVESIRRELDAEPAEVIGLEAPVVPDGVSPAAHANTLAEKLAALGPVNPLALEELSVLEERHHELEVQVSDIRSARRELQEVVRTLNQQIEQTFAEAVADVNEHFSSLVSMLFPGGTGRLVLTDPEDLLNTGVEVEVRPAGRNVRRVSLLSGGERSLSALAFLFAVFRSRPSPFYLMDEVEAALDDVNLHRFLGLVDEFRAEAQFIIVSHQKRTMEAGDALYGVTMAPGGSSQVVSQKVQRHSERAAS